MLEYDSTNYLTGCECDGITPPPPHEHPHPHHPKPAYTMTEQVEQTARAMRETIDRLLKFEKRLSDKMECLGKKLTADNVLFKNTISSAFYTHLEEVKNEVNTFEATLNADFELFKQTITSDYATLSDDCRTQITEYYNQFQTLLNDYKAELNGTYDNFRDSVESRLTVWNENHEAAFNTFVSEINKKLSDMELQFNSDYSTFVNTIESRLTQFETELNNTIDTRLDGQDSVINDAVHYMKTNLKITVENVVNEMLEAGELSGLLEGYATQEDLKGYATTTQLDYANAIIEELQDYKYRRVITPENFGYSETQPIESKILTFQNAVNALQEGDIFYLPGNYELGESSISFTASNVDVIGHKPYSVINFDPTDEVASCFDIQNSNNVTFKNVFISTERTKEEAPPEGHGDVNYPGSNRLAFNMLNCNNLEFINTRFNNLKSDYWIKASNRINVDGWFSRNSSIATFVTYGENITYKNIDIESAAELSPGNHIFYISTNTHEVTVDGGKISASDDTLSCLIAHYTAHGDVVQPTTLYVKNLNCKGSFLYSGNKESGIVTFENVDYHQFYETYLSESTVEGGKVYTAPTYTASVFKSAYFRNSKFHYCTEFFHLDNDNTIRVEFTDCEINAFMDADDTNVSFVGVYGSWTVINRCSISGTESGTFYMTNPNGVLQLEHSKVVGVGSIIRSNYSNYTDSTGNNTGAYITAHDCQFIGDGTSRFIYNRDLGYGENTKLTGCFIEEFSTTYPIASDTDKAGSKIVGCYYNDTLYTG